MPSFPQSGRQGGFRRPRRRSGMWRNPQSNEDGKSALAGPDRCRYTAPRGHGV